jgi:hypothetical protein
MKRKPVKYKYVLNNFITGCPQKTAMYGLFSNKQEVLERINAYFPLIRYGQHRKLKHYGDTDDKVIS